MGDERGAGIHVDIFEADIAIEDEDGIFGNETPLNPVTQPRGYGEALDHG